MRFVVIGAGAIGGVVGARLHQSGHPVVLIARGDHLAAIRSQGGLALVTPLNRTVVPVEAAPGPEAVRWTEDDVVLLATKSQDSLEALLSLRDAAGESVPVVCMQNGVENERVALRLFETVYGAVVMAPTAYLHAGVVQSYGTELSGMIELGRFPTGVDDRCEAIAGALTESAFPSRAVPDVMRLKHAKLLLNLGNAVEALCGDGPASEELAERARSEGEAALAAAGIAFEDAEIGNLDGRWARMGVRPIEGRPRQGSSSWQSLSRRTGSIETDYLNGEIVLAGRMHGVPTPINEALCALAARAAREGGEPGSVDVRDVLALAS